jgi:hypothetical protein
MLLAEQSKHDPVTVLRRGSLAAQSDSVTEQYSHLRPPTPVAIVEHSLPAHECITVLFRGLRRELWSCSRALSLTGDFSVIWSIHLASFRINSHTASRRQFSIRSWYSCNWTWLDWSRLAWYLWWASWTS